MEPIPFKDFIYYGTMLFGFGLNIGYIKYINMRTMDKLDSLEKQVRKTNGQVQDNRCRIENHVENYHTVKS